MYPYRVTFVLAAVLKTAAADLAYHFTMSVSPAPVPGQPFIFTWTGGEQNEAIYIVLNGYFPDTPDQNIVYTTSSILSNAPNNGSWTYNVPPNISAGRHSFSIGYNPLQLSDQTPIFTISPSQTFAPTGSQAPSTSNTAAQTYNGCGLPPLPDYTYTGYQPPCTTTISGKVETLYPIVPGSLSSVFWSGSTQVVETISTTSSSPLTPSLSIDSASSRSDSINTAFATGVFAQALQCPTPITPSPTSFSSGGTTTILSIVACAPTGSSTHPVAGICHSNYKTFSLTGTNSVCCPSDWDTTGLNSEIYCFTSLSGQAQKREARDLGVNKRAETTIKGLVVTKAGIVEASTTSARIEGSSSTVAASTTTPKSGGRRLNFGSWWIFIVAFGSLCF